MISADTLYTHALYKHSPVIIHCITELICFATLNHFRKAVVYDVLRPLLIYFYGHEQRFQKVITTIKELIRFNILATR